MRSDSLTSLTLGYALALLAFGSVGCGALARLAGIEKSAQKTEATTGELNENTKGVKESIDEVDANTKAMKKELEDTRRRLEEANKRLDHTNAMLASLKDIMGAAKENTSDLVGNTGNTYVDLRQGDTLAARARHLDRLEETGALEAKISESWKYFAAFEFQFWKGDGADTPARREALFYEGANEFLREVERYLPEAGRRSASPLSEDPRMSNLYALSVGMEAYNSVQALVSAQALAGGFQRMNMRDLLRGGLVAGLEVEAGRRTLLSLATWERVVLEKRETALYLLQVRMNFLPAIPLARVTDVDRTGIARFMELLRLGFTRWDAPLGSHSNVQIASMNDWLDKSLAERTFLTPHGVSETGIPWARYDTSLTQALSNMRVVDDRAVGSAVDEERRVLVEGFASRALQVASTAAR